jgi:FkbM family methyltransferase
MFRSFLRSIFYRSTAVSADPLASLAAKWQELRSLRHFLRRHRINVVLDVGANEGQFAAKLRRLDFRGKIFSFEPDPTVYNQLAKRCEKDPQWHSFPIALGDADTNATFNLAPRSTLNSFLSPVFPSNVSGQIDVPVRRLDGMFHEVVKECPQPRVLLKTDTQGFDLRVLDGATGCLNKITGILAELSVVPIYQQSPPLHEAVQAYKVAGFHMVDLSLVNRTVDGRILELDGLFIRAAA